MTRSASRPSPDPPSRRPSRDPAGREPGGRADAAAGGRWFLACWPDAATQRALQRVQAAWAWPPGARPTPTAQLHLTLHFIGTLPADALPALRRALDNVHAAAPASWALEEVAIWPNGIAALVPSRVPDAAAALHAALATVLRALGLPVESRPWGPHVTLARRARGATMRGAHAPDAVNWTSTGFELVRSDRGYHRAGRWPRTARA